MRHTQSSKTVSLYAAQDLIETCRSHGILTDNPLEDLGLDPSVKLDAEARIPESKLISLWQLIEKHEVQGAGLKIGTTINPNAKGILASWISQSTNLREALTTFRQHIALMNPSESWAVEDDKASAILSFSLTPGLGYPTIAIERSMSAMVAWARSLSGQDLKLQKASFTFKMPAYLSLFHDIFGPNVEFNCPQNQLILDQETLDLPIISNNPYLRNIIKEKALQTLSEIQDATTLRSQVKNMIEKALVSGESLNIQQASQNLCISRQTLFRQLKQENTDFKSLLDEVKKEQAVTMLMAGQNITSVSLSLGYKDNSSFYKAFHRWFAMPPKAYLASLNQR